MVMRPEPWGEALDELGPTAPRWSSRRPPGGRSPRRWRATWPRGRGWSSRAAATRASTSGSSTTPPRGPRCVEVSLGDYVLNGGEVAALAVIEAVVRLLPGSWATPSRSSRSRTRAACSSTPSTPSPPSWRGLDVPDVLLSGDHARDRRVAARPGATSHGGAPARPAAPEPGRPGVGDRARACAATPARSSPCSGRAGSRRRWPTTCSTSRRCTSPSTTSRRGWTTGTTTSCGSRAGWSAPSAAGSSPLRRGGLGHRPAHGRARPAGPGPRAGRCSSTSRRAAPAAAASYSLFTGARSEDNLRMYKKAGYQPAPRPAGPGRGPCCSPRRISSRLSRLWQTRPSAQSAEGPPGDTPRGSASGSCHRGSPAPPATRTGPLPEQAPPSDTAADLWHSRGAHHDATSSPISATPSSATTSRTSAPVTPSRSTSRSSRATAPASRSSRASVIRIHGSGVGRTFTVRKVSFGVGVERTFPINTPDLREDRDRHPR